jgi:hypothetical protein
VTASRGVCGLFFGRYSVCGDEGGCPVNRRRTGSSGGAFLPSVRRTLVKEGLKARNWMPCAAVAIDDRAGKEILRSSAVRWCERQRHNAARAVHECDVADRRHDLV